ncbi:hypothetical protein V8G54_030700 [Vigna mungo]|uniref:Histidine-containing phosphotransfer protein n=1 Tax=Vigna mungo TaxID=3915 RepID=A0AAQ3MXI7_VIGMU
MASSQYKESQHLGLRGGIQNDKLAFEKIIIMQQEEIKMESLRLSMDGLVQLQKQLVDYTASLFHEGFLDEQFNQLQQLQDESNPDFVVEVVTLFFEDAERLLNELSKTLGQPSIDFKKLDAHVHQLKGSSSSWCLYKYLKFDEVIKNAALEHREFTESAFPSETLARNKTLKVTHEYSLVKSKLETLLRMEQQILAAGG